jgi:hypothetical protein
VIQKIRVDSSTADRCREFAADCAVTNLAAYKRRNQGNIEKITEQILTGKLCEFAVSILLGCDEPDLKIYAAKDKSYDADLSSDGRNIHVKGQSRDSASRYGVSWSFSVWDKLIKTPDPKDYIALCVIDRTDVEFYGLHQMVDITPILGMPKLPQLWSSKRVLYYDDLVLKLSEKHPIG